MDELRPFLNTELLIMCGITGIICSEIQSYSDAIMKMTDSLTHRGPDDFGYIVAADNICAFHSKYPDASLQGRVFLGHRRLSIIDVAGTRQPLANENKNVWIVFNGEIYNYKELRQLLEGKGHTLKEAGDTEVLVHLWEEYGVDMLKYLRGMFAFALFDSNKNTIFIARDRFGQKPLYYWLPRNPNDSRILVFASELQALKTFDNFPFSDFSTNAMASYFRYGYIPNPETIFNNVYSLTPGHYMLLTLDDTTPIPVEYWHPVVCGTEQRVNYDELQSIIDESVKLRLQTDVPLGAFLSGGIDSALITASAVKQLDTSFNTYTIATGNSWCDESKEAKLTANYLNTSHHEFTVKPNFMEIASKLAGHYGQPFADFSSIVTYFVCRETRKHITVALSGDGGDELFAGYNSYLNMAKYDVLGRIPRAFRPGLAFTADKFLKKKKKNVFDAILAAGPLPIKGENISGLFHNYWRQQCFTPEFKAVDDELSTASKERFSSYFRNAASSNPIECWMEADQRMYLCDDILTKVDIASMSVSLECRAPFLDHKLAEFINNISMNLKIYNNESKYLLRKLAHSQIPEKIVNLPKKGFSMPLDIWLKTDLKDWAYSVIFDNSNCYQKFLNHKSVELLWKQHQCGRMDHSARLWQIIALNLTL
jgi:asparagine synthase (glutamine-hydrolysing)